MWLDFGGALGLKPKAFIGNIGINLLTTSKSQCGMGFRDFYHINLSCWLSKLGGLSKIEIVFGHLPFSINIVVRRIFGRLKERVVTRGWGIVFCRVETC